MNANSLIFIELHLFLPELSLPVQILNSDKWLRAENYDNDF